MQNFYDKVSKDLLESVEKYLNSEIELEELLIAQEREKLLYEYKNWDNIKKDLKESIFKMTEKLFREINECEKKIKTFKKLNESNNIECDIDSLISHSFITNRNRMPPAGYEHSNWYLGAYPTVNMIENIYEELDSDEEG